MVDRLPDPAGVPLHLAQAGVDRDGQVYPLGVGVGADTIGARTGNRRQIDGRTIDRQRPRLALRQVQHIVDQHGQAPCALQYAIDIVLGRCAEFPGVARAHHLSEAGDGGQRRAQFVAHIGDEGGRSRPAW